jgi:hypothetical protein
MLYLRDKPFDQQLQFLVSLRHNEVYLLTITIYNWNFGMVYAIIYLKKRRVVG